MGIYCKILKGDTNFDFNKFNIAHSPVTSELFQPNAESSSCRFSLECLRLSVVCVMVLADVHFDIKLTCPRIISPVFLKTKKPLASRMLLSTDQILVVFSFNSVCLLTVYVGSRLVLYTGITDRRCSLSSPSTGEDSNWEL